MGVPKQRYAMDYISDKDTYKAVMFACKMIKDGKGVRTSCRIAAHYYQCDVDDVNHYVSQRGGRNTKR